MTTDERLEALEARLAELEAQVKRNREEAARWHNAACETMRDIKTPRYYPAHP